MNLSIDNVTNLHLHIAPAIQDLASAFAEFDNDKHMVATVHAEERIVPKSADPSDPPAYGEYWPGQGGFYAGMVPPLHGAPARHLIFSESQADALKWGAYGEDRPGARSHFDGKANTAALLIAVDHPAAAWAAGIEADGHKDFYLPSQLELMIAFVCAGHRFRKEGWYWSSTQTSAHRAFVQGFQNGGSKWLDKASEYQARAVRSCLALQPFATSERGTA